jgi:nitrite reductase/ring-hydroxylating ferredoxin subunit
MAWTKVAAMHELPAGSLLEYICREGDLYAICNVNGDVRALCGVCPHQGGPLGQGAMEDGWVTCPWHAWQFDSATGRCAFNGELRVETYPARVEHGAVLVKLPDHA